MSSLSELQAERHREEAIQRRKEAGEEVDPKDEDESDPNEKAVKNRPQWRFYRNVSGVMPRPCIKATIFIFGILSIVLSILTILSGIVQLFSPDYRRSNWVGIAFLFLYGIPLFVGGVSFIVSAFKKESSKKCDGCFSITALVIFFVICVLMGLQNALNMIVGILVSLTYPGLSETQRTNGIVAVLISAAITFLCCIICCCPCVITGSLNVFYVFPPKKKTVKKEEEEKGKKKEEKDEVVESEEDSNSNEEEIQQAPSANDTIPSVDGFQMTNNAGQGGLRDFQNFQQVNNNNINPGQQLQHIGGSHIGMEEQQPVMHSGGAVMVQQNSLPPFQPSVPVYTQNTIDNDKAQVEN